MATKLSLNTVCQVYKQRIQHYNQDTNSISAYFNSNADDLDCLKERERERES